MCCYTCQHYQNQIEKVGKRNAKGEVKQVDAHIERCAAREDAKLRVPIVQHTQEAIVLMSREQFEQVVADATEQGRPKPYIFGSEQRYFDEAGNLVECQLYERMEKRYE